MIVKFIKNEINRKFFKDLGYFVWVFLKNFFNIFLGLKYMVFYCYSEW